MNEFAKDFDYIKVDLFRSILGTQKEVNPVEAAEATKVVFGVLFND